MAAQHDDEAFDGGAFERIVDEHAPAVLRLARAIATDDAAADALVQETFVAAFRSPADDRPRDGALRPWLLALARRAAPRTRVDDDVELMALAIEAGWGATGDPEAPEERDRLTRAIAALDPTDREILVLRDLEGLSSEAAAEVLELGIPAMKSGLHRARLRLVAALRAVPGDRVAEPREVGGLTCAEAVARLGDFVDGELPADDVSRVEAHLRGCAACGPLAGRYAGIVHAARTHAGPPPALDLWQLERIRSRLR